MMKPIGLFAATALALGLAWAVWPTGGTASGLLAYDDPDVVAKGAPIYAAHCASCHGADLEGQENWRSPGPNGRLPAPPHDETGHTWHHPDEVLFRITKLGTAAVVGNGYESDMIGFGDVLSDAEIAAVLAYIKSTWPDEVIEIHNGINADAAGG